MRSINFHILKKISKRIHNMYALIRYAIYFLDNILLKYKDILYYKEVCENIIIQKYKY